MYESVDSLSANPTKWLNRLKQFARNLPANCLNVFDHFVGLALKGSVISDALTNLDFPTMMGELVLFSIIL